MYIPGGPEAAAAEPGPVEVEVPPVVPMARADEPLAAHCWFELVGTVTAKSMPC